MSGIGIPYGDRPLAYTSQGAGAFATPEFLQFLERLNAGHSNTVAGGVQLQDQLDTNTRAIAQLASAFNTAQGAAAAVAGDATRAASEIRVLNTHFPTQAVLAAAGAVALTSGTVAQVITEPVPDGVCVLFGTVYLTGTGSVTLASASVGVTAAAIETTPGAFVTGWFGGASPGGLGMDLTIAGMTSQLSVPSGSGATGYLNVNATFTGTLSCYGSMICWLADG